RCFEVVELEDHHVAAVAAASLQVAAGRRSVLLRRDDLEERVADREDGVAEAERADPGILERLEQAESLPQPACHRVQVARGQDGLPQTHAGRHQALSGAKRGSRFSRKLATPSVKSGFVNDATISSFA